MIGASVVLIAYVLGLLNGAMLARPRKVRPSHPVIGKELRKVLYSRKKEWL